jgi:hypothetical protein
MLFAACPAYCADYFVAPYGSDSNSGTTINSAFKTITKAVELVNAGDTIYLRGGVHYYTATISISKSGSSGNPITLQNYQNETVILDFNGQPDGDSYKGIILSGSYWHFKGFTIRYAGHNGLNVSGAHNIIEQLVTHNNGDTGLHLASGASYNLVLNCDSYLNCDPEENGEDADGFGAKFTVGLGNIFRGCRSWNNSDDGYDLWYAGNPIRFEDCWAFRNGVNLWGFSPMNGDGNGFKLGQGTGGHTLIRCMAYQQAHRGFDRNGNTSGGITIYNCTGVNNASSNFYFDDSNTANWYILRNNISYLGSVTMHHPNVDDQNNSWNGFTVTNADFASLDANFPPITDPNNYDNTNSVGIDRPRGPDGELPKLAFLRLAATSSMIDAGIDVNEPFYGNAPDLGAFERLGGDCKINGYVNLADLACLAANWANTACGICNGADFDGDNKVDFYDLNIMAENWLK